jgi:hypothetical protein
MCLWKTLIYLYHKIFERDTEKDDENKDYKYIELNQYSNDIYNNNNTIVLLNNNITNTNSRKNKKEEIEDEFVIINLN